MLPSVQRLESTAISVAVIPENPQCPAVADIRKAELSPGGSLVCCLLEPRGQLLLWDAADRETPAAAVDGSCSDFSWEEYSGVPDLSGGSRPRLVAVGSGCDLKLLEVEAERSVSISVLCVSDCPADHLLKTVWQQDHSVSQLRSLRLLSFVTGRCFVLLNDHWLLQLHWQCQEAEPQILTCCSIKQPTPEGGDDAAVHQCVCGGAAFVLSSSGLISVCDITDGRLLARVDLPAYLSSSLDEDDFMVSCCSSSPPETWSSFCLLQVSADLSTAVAVTQTHTAVAVDLDEYFRTFPDHLLCAALPARPAPGPQYPGDQDAESNSTHVVTNLGFTFSTERSWEARLSSLHSRALQTPSRSSSSSRPSRPSWSSSLPHLDSHLTRPWSHSMVPCGGASVSFPVPESSRPALLSVSGFSAVLTFVCPRNQRTTVACWDWQQDSVSVHQGDGEAAPLLRCGERQHRLLLQKDGVVQVLFSVSQQDLLSKLMLFGSAATVDAVCHLNSWGRCSIPIHSLQAGLKNRQLDTVDFYLKSKENVLDESAADQSLTESVQLLCPALDLLCSSVRESNSEAQSRQFSEQLLSITLNFVNTQIRTVLSSTCYEDPDVHSCVDVLHRYLTELRSYMKKFPWPAGGSTCTTDSSTQQRKEDQQDEWERLPMEEVVRQSILTNQIPRAQAVLRRRGLPEQRLSSLRTEGLRQVFSCLQQQDLSTATSLLVNMGFNVKDQLHRLCLYTDDRHLRELVVEELRRRSYFSKEELQKVEFIRQVEKLGSLPTPPRRPANFTPRGSVQMLGRETGVGEEVLEELLSSRRSGEEARLWTNLRLDWVRNWDQSCQSAVLLSRLEHTELGSRDPVVLWRHLTSIHNQHHIVRWIQDQETACAASQWPELVPELVNNNTLCSVYMKEKILDLLARRGLFIPDELEDLQRLLWRLAQGGGVMATAPSLPRYRSSQGLDLHALFITFCLDHGLQYLLYTYLQHHRLTPRNCPPLSSQSLSESQPWFEMMVKIQEITRDLTDPALIFQASLTSAQVLLPGSQASLSSLLLEGHSLLALAAVMFAPGGIDQVVLQGESSSKSERTVDPQLLKMALAPHSKLKAALFPTTPRGHGVSSDISIYHLLQSLHPLDPSRLFGWQTANTISSTETSELPHFSSPQLVQMFALVENLDFLYYLRHGRPSFAYATFLVQQLNNGCDRTLICQQAEQGAYRLALQNFHVASVTSAAVCFCELLGVCSLKLRVDVRAMNTVLNHWNQHSSHSDPLHRLQTLGQKLVEAEPGAAAELIGWLEAAVSESVEQKGLVRSSYEASQEWTVPVQFCQLHSLDLSSVYPAHCAQDGHYIHFLLFVQLHSFPPQQVRKLAAGFGPALQAHLSLVFQDLHVRPQAQRAGDSGSEDPECLSTAKASGSGDQPRELFQVLLQSQDQGSPCRFLLRQSLLQRCPTLAVIAACPQGAEPLACLCVWVLTSVDDVTAGEATTHLIEPAQHTEWTLQDLSIIWKTLLGRGQVRPLLQGFQLFLKDCPLVLMLSMFDLCCDYRNFSEAKEKLLDFQRTLITLRTSGSVSSTLLPLPWVEAQASVLLLTLLERCSSRYDLHHLLQLLADVDVLLKSNGPDFRMLSQLSQLLQDSDLTLSPRLLQCTSPSVQQEEFQATVDALQARGRYTQARQVAELAGLPVHHLLLGQLLQEVNSFRSKPQWRRLETRVSFWKKCQEQLKEDGPQPGSAAQFFLSQAEGPTRTAAEDTETKLLDTKERCLLLDTQERCLLLDTQERCLLLGLAAHWLSLLHPPPVQELQSLEERQWRSRVQLQLLTSSMERQSVFNLPGSNLGPDVDVDVYRALVEEFSFSHISALNTDNFLSTDGLPAPVGAGQQDPNVQSALTPEEREVLLLLVGQLLDQGSVHEASRVCRYFGLHHPDLWLVLRCRGLASGELRPQPQDKTAEEEPISRVPSSASFGSLSLSMLSLPEDQVVLELQRLVDRCRHGATYCKQVLSLYRLSKELQISFSQVSSEEPRSVLEALLQSEQPERFRKAQVFIRAQGLSPDCVAQLVCSAVTRSLLTPSPTSTPTTQELQTERLVFRPSEGRDSLIQLIRLCEDPNLVGVRLMEELGTVSLRDLSCIVELLIVAHDCFSLTCNMEGIVRVLQAARHLSHAHLAPGEHYSLLVRLLTGVGRYTEMTYVFDLLHQNHRFEMLLRKKVDMDRGQSSSLKTALLDYIKRCLPADSEKYNMVALCFSMRREIGENHEMAARTQLKMIESQPWVVTADLISSLVKVLALLKDAAESFSKDWCVRQATRCVRTAKLVSLQLHFLNQGSDVRVINLRPAELLNAVVLLPRCYQVFVVSEAYSYSPDWAEILHQKVVLKGDFVFLEELRRHRPLTSSLFEDVFKKLDSAPSSVTPNVKRLLSYCDDVYTRYRLAYQRSLNDVAENLLQDVKTSNYLNDRLSS